MSKTKYDEEINEIRKGFEMFDVENKGQINPFELKETMEEMNLKDKNPFLYELISSLCSRKDIKSKGGLTSDDFISILQENISDVESKHGIKNIYHVFSDSDNKVAMPAFYQVAKEVGDEEGGVEIRNLVELSKTGGKEIDFDEFYDIMKEKYLMNKYSNYSYKNKVSGENNSTQTKGKSSGKKENDSDYDSYRKKNISKTEENSFVEKNATEQVNDSPEKVARYRYRWGRENKVKEKEDKRMDVNHNTYPNKKKSKEEEIIDDDKDNAIEVKRYHRRFRENRTNTEN